MAFELISPDLLVQAMEAERDLTRSRNRWIDEVRMLDVVLRRGERKASVNANAPSALLTPSASQSTRRRAGSAALRVARLMRPWTPG